MQTVWPAYIGEVVRSRNNPRSIHDQSSSYRGRKCVDQLPLFFFVSLALLLYLFPSCIYPYLFSSDAESPCFPCQLP